MRRDDRFPRPGIVDRCPALHGGTSQRGGFVFPVEDREEAVVGALGDPESKRLIDATTLEIRTRQHPERIGKLHGFRHELDSLGRGFCEVAGNFDGRPADGAKVEPAQPGGLVEVWTPADGIDIREHRAAAHEEIRVQRPKGNASREIPVSLAYVLGVAEVVGFEADERMAKTLKESAVTSRGTTGNPGSPGANGPA